MDEARPATPVTRRPAARRRAPCLAVLGLLALGAAPSSGAAETQLPDPPAAAADLTALEPDQLMQVEVTSVSRKRETRWRTPAAISVVSRDDIRRSGATSIVEVLRLVPGLHVARI